MCKNGKTNREILENLDRFKEVLERIYQKKEYEYKFLADRYEVKFRKWYDSRSCPFSVFLPVDGNIF